MASAESIDLSKILTLELFESLRRTQLPWPEDQPLNFTTVAKLFFGGEPDTRADYYRLTFHQALKPLSTLGVENMPDLMQFLPPPEANDFPSKAAGLLFLLDQAPRSTLSGVNERYIYGHFDAFASKLALQLLALPPHLRPDTMERLMMQGWSYDYAMVARFWFYIPLVHSENLENHEKQLILMEAVRSDVEKHVGKKDPGREKMAEDLTDIYGFPKVVTEPPIRNGSEIDDFFFWLMRLVVVHVPIIRKFSRYPYRNNSLGRISTKDEKQYAEDTDYFATQTDEEVIKKILADVEAGRWSPLVQDEPGSA
ncbi:uncharacterized protein PHACADRAFT_31212 [Phanerochaete carnosa HHB-10118-sp]|uniref:Uncharacterized protein n=1 Tax=Phanerochaete carnosa (strain HHB-10118-sp) TaxID=650164 RepID=K5W1I0_PHACS|nr:uncharacterized protein PHACADRAFT_31212 [Phanerochaete carnosa HHB-10118-sp]EKM52749.1 hypothetical protein PHACADRAFT_31212 [Phanerochaete carnosa HHB-10118-sp]